MMIDPLLKGFDMPVMIEYPIKTEEVPRLDAILVTHADNDHYSVPTTNDLTEVTKSYHSTQFADVFKVGPVRITVTPVDHAWQNAYPGTSPRKFKDEDSCGFWIETPDGTIWATGDSKLMPEHLTMPTPDAILFDWSDSEWHFTFEGAVKLANAYPNTILLLNHWGSVDAPDFPPFNADPKDLNDVVVNPERIVVLAPGEPFTLERIKK